MLLMLSLASALALSAGPISTRLLEQEVWVDDDYDFFTTPGFGFTHFDTLERGIAGVKDNGIVHVQPGTYTTTWGTFVLKPGLTIVGEGATQPILQGTALAGRVVEVTVPDGTLRNLDIRSPNGSTDDTVFATGDRFRLENCTIRGGIPIEGHEGVRCDSLGGVIEGNLIQGVGNRGFHAIRAVLHGGIVRRNIVRDCYEGILIAGTDTIVEENTVSAGRSGISVSGDRVDAANNLIDSCLFGIQSSAHCSVRGNRIIMDPGSPLSGQFTTGIVASSFGSEGTPLEILDNTVKNYRRGISVTSAPSHPGTGAIVRGNRVFGAKREQASLETYGSVVASDNAFFSRSDAAGIRVGKGPIHAHHNLVIGHQYAIDLRGRRSELSDLNVFQRNVLIGNGSLASRGLYHHEELVENWFNRVFVLENAFLSSGIGAFSERRVGNGFLFDNVFAGSQTGLHVTQQSVWWNWTVLGNSFDNTANALVDGTASFFSLPQGRGNYWSDYAGADANGDGIGDTPHFLPGLTGASDDLPLMEPGRQAVMWADLYDGPANSPPAVTLHINAGRSHAGRTFVILPSQSGLQPETPLPNGAELPIAADGLTALVWNATGPIFAAFRGTLDAQGRGVTTIQLPPLPASFEDTFLYFAAVIGPAWDRPTNAIGFYWR